MYFYFLYTFPGFIHERPLISKEEYFWKSFLQVLHVKNERYSNVNFFSGFSSFFFGQTDDVGYWGCNGFF